LRQIKQTGTVQWIIVALYQIWIFIFRNSDLGRWGNGDVEVALNSLDELPYVIGLVRQAFEKQMGNGETGA